MTVPPLKNKYKIFKDLFGFDVVMNYICIKYNTNTFMDKKTGYEYAVEHGYTVDRGNFYRLFKTIARLKTLTPAEKIVLSIILSYTDNGQEFYMSNNSLALETGMGYSSTVRIISSLREKGFIKTYKIYDKSRRLVIGRVATPQRGLLAQAVEKSYNEYEYIEYGKEEDS